MVGGADNGRYFGNILVSEIGVPIYVKYRRGTDSGPVSADILNHGTDSGPVSADILNHGHERTLKTPKKSRNTGKRLDRH